MKKLKEEEIKKILRLRESGLTYKEISFQIAFGINTVQKYCSVYRPELKNIKKEKQREEVVEEITRLRRKGYSMGKISKELGIAYVLVAQICKEYCPGLRKIGHRKIDQKKLDIIERNYKGGYTTKELARMAGCHISTVARYLKKRGVKLPLTLYRNGINRKKKTCSY